MVDQLLTVCPDLVTSVTVEQWSALHAACINGSVDVARMLIEWSYPEHALRAFRMDGGGGGEGSYECRLPFDPNARDITGQTPLYVACLLGNTALVKLLLDWRVPFERVAVDASDADDGLLVSGTQANGSSSRISHTFRPPSADIHARRIDHRVGHHNAIEARRVTRHPIDHGASVPRP